MRSYYYNTSIALREVFSRISPVEFGPSPVKRRRAFFVGALGKSDVVRTAEAGGQVASTARGRTPEGGRGWHVATRCVRFCDKHAASEREVSFDIQHPQSGFVPTVYPEPINAGRQYEGKSLAGPSPEIAERLPGPGEIHALTTTVNMVKLMRGDSFF